jgi:hypothetical protein
MPYGQILSDSITDSSGGVLAPSSSVFRNRILNGDMRIDQRNAGAAVTVGAGVYTLDRWFSYDLSDAVFTAQQVSDAPAGFVNSAKITITTADASIGASQYNYFNQRIEGLNISDLAWGTASAASVTLSFWVRSSLTGTFGGALHNSAYNRSYPFTYAISSANTWEKKTVTIAGDTSGTWLTTNGIGIVVNFDLGSGTDNTGTAGAWVGAGNVGADSTVQLASTLNATWYITGVQLEKGSTATSFDVRPYGTELNLCQRYLYVVSVDTNFNYFGQAFSTTAASATVPLPVQPRVAPTGITTSGTIVMTTSNGSSSGGTLAFKSSTLDHCTVGITGGSGLTAGYSSSLISTSGTQTIQFTGCEL